LNKQIKRAMEGVYQFPIKGRTEKPRAKGLTMVIDMGSGLNETRDFLDYAGRYIDMFKISSGTAALYSDTLLREKIEIIHSYDIEVEAGGSHYEVANWKGVRGKYFHSLLEIGFDVVEIADGHLPIADKERLKSIKEAKDLGLKVATEIGKKETSKNIKAPTIIQQFNEDINAGSDYIIIEGKASGMEVGIFDEKGNINDEELTEIVNGIKNLDMVIWEAPLRMQEQSLILRFGPNVNLGNIFPKEVYPLELMRNGLMLMPLINVYNEEQGNRSNKLN
jgi:phosphosulfolactate synthase